MADPIVIGGGALAALVIASRGNKGSVPATPAQQPQAERAQLVKQDVTNAIQSGLGKAFSNPTAALIASTAVGAGTATLLGAIGAIITGTGGFAGVVIAVAIFAIGFTVAGVIEIVNLIHDLAANEQWRAVEKYENDWVAVRNKCAEQIRLTLATQGKNAPDIETAAGAYADGFMRRQAWQGQMFAMFGAGHGPFGGYDGKPIPIIGNNAWTDAWRASNTGKAYGTPNGDRWNAVRAANNGHYPDLRYGGGEDLGLWSPVPARKTVGCDNWYAAGRAMANVSAFVTAMQQEIGLGQSPTAHAVWWRDNGFFQGAIRQDVPGAAIPVLEFEGQLWSYTLPGGIGGFKPVYLGKA